MEDARAILGPPSGPHAALPQEFFAVPVNASLDGLTLQVRAAGQQWSASLEKGAQLPLSAGSGASRFEVRWDALPLPPKQSVPGTHPDRAEELRALGYTGD